jgi:cytochrome c-type biogenesis protein CcmH
MLLWIVLALMTAAVVILLVLPLARRPAELPLRSQYDVALYRTQLDEVARDVERGVIGSDEADAARLEIERRMLAAAPKAPPTESTRMPLARWAALATLLLVPAISVPLYLWLGAPNEPDAPLSARGDETELLTADGQLDVQKARKALETKLALHPDSLEGWMLLARTDGALGKYDEARAALDKALTLSNRSAEVVQADAELLTSEAKGLVTADAKALFEEALKKQPDSVVSRYHLALYRAQQGDLAGAITDWRALEKDAPADAPWRRAVDSSIAEAQRGLGLPVDTPPPPPVPQATPDQAAMMKLPPAERLQAIRSMVAGLQAKLDANPNDLQGWLKLGRSYRVLGEPGKATLAYAKAVGMAPDDADIALQRAQTLREAGGEDGPLTPELIEAYRHVASLTPDQPEALWILGLAAKQAGNTTEATKLFQQLLAQMKPDAPEAEDVKKQLAALPKAN